MSTLSKENSDADFASVTEESDRSGSSIAPTNNKNLLRKMTLKEEQRKYNLTYGFT